jgi:hypothetical protein
MRKSYAVLLLSVVLIPATASSDPQVDSRFPGPDVLLIGFKDNVTAESVKLLFSMPIMAGRQKYPLTILYADESMTKLGKRGNPFETRAETEKVDPVPTCRTTVKNVGAPFDQEYEKWMGELKEPRLKRFTYFWPASASLEAFGGVETGYRRVSGGFGRGDIDVNSREGDPRAMTDWVNRKATLEQDIKQRTVIMWWCDSARYLNSSLSNSKPRPTENSSPKGGVDSIGALRYLTNSANMVLEQLAAEGDSSLAADKLAILSSLYTLVMRELSEPNESPEQN